MSKILIAGCGDLGTRLGLALSQHHTVFGLRRSATLPSPLLFIQASLTDRASLSQLPEIETVFYTAAADAHTPEAYQQAYVTGVENLLAALPSSVKRFFFISSTGVYHQHQGEWVDETSDTHPTYFSGSSLLAGEQRVHAAGLNSTVIRLAGIYGPGRTQLIDRVREGKVALPREDYYTNRIHIEDCVGILEHLYNLDHCEPCYIGCDDQPSSYREVITWLTARLNAPTPETAQAPSAPERGNKRCSNQRLKNSGYQCRYPTYQAGYSAMLATRP